MKRISFYFLLLFIYPLSILPFSVLYRISDILFIFIYYIFKYRRNVVFSNLQKAFPQKSKKELQSIEKKFFKNLCDLIIESIKTFTISRKEIAERVKVVNPEITYPYFENGQSLIVIPAHYGNWEMAGLSSALYVKHKIMGVYKPLSNPYFNDLIQKTRGRFGLELVAMKEVPHYFEKNIKNPNISIFVSDQSPSNPDKAYWTKFLGIDTAVQFGAEKYAKSYNYPVMWATVQREKRGYYTLTLKLISENPGEEPYGAITEKHTRELEHLIQQWPQNWLWSHKRWKHKRKTAEAAANGK